jgi:hypothetical protein
METWCDWLNAIMGDLTVVAEELKQSLASGLQARQSIAESLRLSQVPGNAFLAVPGLQRKAALANTIARDASQVDARGQAELRALEELAKSLVVLRDCCP